MAHSTASLAQANIIDVNDETAKGRVIEVIASAFASTPIIISLITELDKTPPPYPSLALDIARFRRHYRPKITDLAGKPGVELVEINDFSAIAIWETACFLPSNESQQEDPARPLVNEWNSKLQKIQQRFLNIGRYYHLAFLARNPETEHIPGAISAVVRPWLRRAEEEKVLVWLEAASERSMLIYKHFGFRVIETIRIGEGTRSSDGWPKDRGDGVVLYAMAYDKHLRPEDNV